MVRRSILSVVVLGSGLLLAAPARPQDNAAPPPQQKQPAANSDQKKDQKKPATAEQNPFPESQSEAAAKKVQQQEQREDEEAAPPAPAPQNTQNGKTAEQNPFPESESEKAAHRDQQPNGASPGRAGGDFSSSQVNGLDLPGSEAGPKTGPPAPHGYNPQLAKTDTKVGLFYLGTGDYKGAYDRFVEATQSDPGNAEAVYGLGESALRLNKRDAALRNFRLYLSALPDGPHAKEIRKTMKKMGVEPPA